MVGGKLLTVVGGNVLVVVGGKVLVVAGGSMEATASLVAAPTPSPEQAEATSRTAHKSQFRRRTVKPYIAPPQIIDSGQ